MLSGAARRPAIGRGALRQTAAAFLTEAVTNCGDYMQVQIAVHARSCPMAVLTIAASSATSAAVLMLVRAVTHSFLQLDFTRRMRRRRTQMLLAFVRGQVSLHAGLPKIRGIIRSTGRRYAGHHLITALHFTRGPSMAIRRTGRRCIDFSLTRITRSLMQFTCPLHLRRTVPRLATSRRAAHPRMGQR